MRPLRFSIWCLVLILGVMGTAAAEPRAGDVAPDFTLLGSDGKTYTLDQFKGQRGLVLAWFPKAFTPG
jgi:peroxiredoxin Q/BCP